MSAPTTPTLPPPHRPPPAPKARGLASPKVVAGGIGVVLLLGLGVAALRFSRSPGVKAIGGSPAEGQRSPSTPSAAPAFQPQVESRNFQVAEASGRVEVLRDGVWTLVKPGDVLTQDDVVKTGLGRALLRSGTATEIELRDRVEIRLDSISGAGTSVDLRHGKVVAHVGRTGDNVAITAAHTRTANVGALPARFVVTADERGRVAVATIEGAAQFESAGRAVTVSAGSETRAEPGAPPVDPETIAEDVLLTVAWPSGERHEEKLPIAGKVGPGSQVRVNGAPATLDADGHFTASIAMRSGPNLVEVEVEDASGRSKRERRDIKKVATRPPDLAPVPVELWRK
jgi:hypothetical protein